MALQKKMTGKDYLVYVGNSDSPQNWVFLCMATTAQFTLNTTFDEASLRDCLDPSKPLKRSSVPRMLSGELALSGVMDPESYKDLLLPKKLDSESLDLILLKNLPVSDGGGFFHATFFIEQLQEGTQELGHVTFSANLRSDGDIAWEAENPQA